MMYEILNNPKKWLMNIYLKICYKQEIDWKLQDDKALSFFSCGKIATKFTVWTISCAVQWHFYAAMGIVLVSMCLEFSFEGTPRTTTESFEDGLKYPKQIKRESPPIRAFEGAITKGKPYDGITTIKEMGRSIHEIPRQDILTQESRKTPDVVQSTRPIIEGSISQVTGLWFFLPVIPL